MGGGFVGATPCKTLQGYLRFLRVDVELLKALHLYVKGFKAPRAKFVSVAVHVDRDHSTQVQIRGLYAMGGVGADSKET